MNIENKDNRFAILLLQFLKQTASYPGEIMIDFDDNGHLYAKSLDGLTIIPITKSILNRLEEFIENAGTEINVNVEGLTNVELEKVLNEMKKYIDASIEGLAIKDPVKVVSETNILLSGLSIIDDIQLELDDRILVNGQTDKKLNGIYNVKEDNWIRSDDLNETSEINKKPFVFVQQGTKYGGTAWILLNDNDLVIGVDDIIFEQFSRAEDLVAVNGLYKSGNEIGMRQIHSESKYATLVEYDEFGRVINGSKPSSASDLGIDDIAPISHVGEGGDAHAMSSSEQHGFMTSEQHNELKKNTLDIFTLEQEIVEDLLKKTEYELISGEYQISLGGETVIIVDNLESDDPTKVLSARQGKILYDMIKRVFTNNNENFKGIQNIWTGTLSEYMSINNHDPNTMYFTANTESSVYSVQTRNMTVYSRSIDMPVQPIDDMPVLPIDNNFNSEVIFEDCEFKGKIFYNGQELSDILFKYTHIIDDMLIINTKLKTLENHRHKLSNLEGDVNNRTVSDNEKDAWNNDYKKSIGQHNMNIDSHKDIREDILKISDNIHNNPIRLINKYEYVTPGDLNNPYVNISLEFNRNKDTVMVFNKSLLIPPSMYTLTDDGIIFNDSYLPLENGSEIVIHIITPIGFIVADTSEFIGTQEEWDSLESNKQLSYKKVFIVEVRGEEENEG